MRSFILNCILCSVFVFNVDASHRHHHAVTDDQGDHPRRASAALQLDSSLSSDGEDTFGDVEVAQVVGEGNGVVGPNHGDVVVQIPGHDDPETRRSLLSQIGVLEGIALTQGIPFNQPDDLFNLDNDRLEYYLQMLASIAHLHGFKSDGRATTQADIPGSSDNIQRCGGRFWEISRNVLLGLGAVVEIAGGFAGFLHSTEILTGTGQEVFRIMSVVGVPSGAVFLTAGAVAYKQVQSRLSEAKVAADRYNTETLGLPPLYSVAHANTGAPAV